MVCTAKLISPLQEQGMQQLLREMSAGLQAWGANDKSAEHHMLFGAQRNTFWLHAKHGL